MVPLDILYPIVGRNGGTLCRCDRPDSRPLVKLSIFQWESVSNLTTLQSLTIAGRTPRRRPKLRPFEQYWLNQRDNKTNFWRTRRIVNKLFHLPCRIFCHKCMLLLPKLLQKMLTLLLTHPRQVQKTWDKQRPTGERDRYSESHITQQSD